MLYRSRIGVRLIALILYVLFFLVCVTQNSLLADDLLNYGTPYIQHFTKKEYKAGNKNWSITQDEDGIMYFGNSNGLLQFDGIRWFKHNLPGGNIVRAVFADGDRIYSGSLGEFGYWEKDENFNLHYFSISNSMTDYEFGDEEIWWIVKLKDEIYFQSFATTFVYDGEKAEIILSNLGTIFLPFVINNKLYIQSINHGIFEIKDGESTLVKGSEIFVGKRVKMIASFSDYSTLLIGTENNGLFIYSNNEFGKWNESANQLISAHQINRGVKINEHLFAIGTILGGIFILNEDGIILNQISRESGLNNNTVLSFFIDRKNNLWVGLDDGIDLIKINSPLYYFTDVTGNIGSVYTAVNHDGTLYLGTNRGVFYKNFNIRQGFSNEKFTLIPGSQGQVWNLSVVNNTLFCGHNNVTYTIDQFKMKRISDISGGFDFKLYPYDDDYLFQGAYNGLFVYKNENNSWRLSHSVSGFNKLSKIIAFERENIVWVSHPYQGIYRLELSENLKEVNELRSFSQQSKTYINILNNKIVFSSDSGFVYYDDIQNNFFTLNKLNKSLGEFSENSHFIEATNDNYWIFKDGDCIKAVMDDNMFHDMDDDFLNDLNEFLIPGQESIYVLDSIYTFIFLDNGFAIFNYDWKDWKPDYHPQILLRQIDFMNINGEKLKKVNNLKEIPYRYNHIKIDFSYPEYARDIDLIYKLEGYNNQWISAGNQEYIRFQNLPYGEYIFKIMPETGSSYEELAIEFTINPPWYKGTTARVVYYVFVLFLLVMYIYLNRRKIKRINEKHEIERIRLLENETAEAERKIIKIRNKNLRNEIKLRNNRLAKSTFSLIHKNNTLISVKDELTKIKEELGVRFPSKYFNRIIRNINKDLSSENDWKMFEHSFSEVHENFLHKLKEEYPDLTPADLQLCAYLKMNLSSKEIASLLNITVRGVEIRRYRLRKKLHLNHDKNLVEYIMGY